MDIMIDGRSVRNLLVALSLVVVAPSAGKAAAEITVGSARVVVADVSAQSALASRRLAPADEVRYQELIATERSSAAVIQFVDATELAIGEQARVRLDAFVFDPGAAGRLDLTLEFGALRFATGTMEKSAYRIATPSATLAVRGTEFDLAVDRDGTTYLMVRHGEVEITGKSGETKRVRFDQSLSVSAVGVPSDPRLAAAAPVGALPGKIAAMDQALAGAIGDSAVDGLDELTVLAKARSLHATHPDLGKPGKPGKPGKDKKAGGPGPF